PDRNAVFEGYTIPDDWSYDNAGNINSGFALTGNTLLFTTFLQRLVALDVRDGHELWHVQLPNITMSTPIVANGMVFIGTGKSGVLKRNAMQRVQFAGKDVWGVSGGDEVAAFDLRTGAPRWTFKTVGEDMPSAMYDRGRLIFANGDFHAYALDAKSGKQVWSTDVGGMSTMSNALMAGDVAIFGVCTPHSGGIATESVALDPSDGKLLWRSEYGHCDSTPSYGNGKVFVNDVLPGDMALRKTTIVAALDAQTGKTAWLYSGKSHGLWSIVGSDQVAVAGTYADNTYYQPAPLDDELIAFDANSGKIRWRFHTSGPAKMSPVIKQGRLYIGDVAGMFYTLDTRDGKLLEIREFKKPFSVSPPIAAGNKLVVANGTSVYAIPLTGRPHISERVGWGIVSGSKQQDDM
ncbi:MAG TPA: PQQ-binding-like beta-propeller repeat protein, partial [Candidatus Baltobacteraceae bacterium]|nr:PQQ-binding-like beta-propeller repeat protein [Candidatus Baltobacteraceae bacterium]